MVDLLNIRVGRAAIGRPSPPIFVFLCGDNLRAPSSQRGWAAAGCLASGSAEERIFSQVTLAQPGSTFHPKQCLSNLTGQRPLPQVPSSLSLPITPPWSSHSPLCCLHPSEVGLALQGPHLYSFTSTRPCTSNTGHTHTLFLFNLSLKNSHLYAKGDKLYCWWHRRGPSPRVQLCLLVLTQKLRQTLSERNMHLACPSQPHPTPAPSLFRRSHRGGGGGPAYSAWFSR